MLKVKIELAIILLIHNPRVNQRVSKLENIIRNKHRMTNNSCESIQFDCQERIYEHFECEKNCFLSNSIQFDDLINNLTISRTESPKVTQ
ncbi:hypothetical protein V12G01_08053 [Vibrio alginolyticus 12G01]|nr:hypothetical protein V12G01_08053 [Vibrio alginolyticus 12G01]KPM86734.1 hypothetical protein AOR09_18740 [Vibrio alginolyticus]KPM95340.1 hypothetical protein AOG25_25130 [Vibrio alginolyticus]